MIHDAANAGPAKLFWLIYTGCRRVKKLNCIQEHSLATWGQSCHLQDKSLLDKETDHVWKLVTTMTTISTIYCLCIQVYMCMYSIYVFRSGNFSKILLTLKTAVAVHTFEPCGAQIPGSFLVVFFHFQISNVALPPTHVPASRALKTNKKRKWQN